MAMEYLRTLYDHAATAWRQGLPLFKGQAGDSGG